MTLFDYARSKPTPELEPSRCPVCQKHAAYYRRSIRGLVCIVCWALGNLADAGLLEPDKV